MPFARDTFIDLLAICGSAPYPGCRFAANVLLAREQISRRFAAGIDFRWQRDPRTGAPAVPYAAFAWCDQEGASLAPGLDALMYSNPTSAASQRAAAGDSNAQRALYYLSYPNGWDGVPAGPTPPFGPYPAFLANANALAAQLKATVLDGVTINGVTVFAAMSSDDFVAARAPYVAAFASLDFYNRGDLAYYATGGSCTAAPGVAYPLQIYNRLVPGYNELNPAETPEIIVPAPGSYSVRTEGYVQSDSMANPTTITLSIRVSGVEVATRSVVRNSGDPGQYVRLPRDTAVISIDGPLTMANSAASTQRGPVSFLIWSNP